MSRELELNLGGEDKSKQISQLVRPARGRGANVFAVFRENKLALAGVVIIVLIVLFCFVGPLLYHTNQIATNLNVANDPPGAGHPLGTDNVGYDELGRLMVGGQSSLEIGIVAALLAGFFGVFWGAIAGFFRGIVGTIMMRIVDAFLAIPILFVLLLMAAIMLVGIVAYTQLPVSALPQVDYPTIQVTVAGTGAPDTRGDVDPPHA